MAAKYTNFPRRDTAEYSDLKEVFTRIKSNVYGALRRRKLTVVKIKSL